jgi:hypothetical protein
MKNALQDADNDTKNALPQTPNIKSNGENLQKPCGKNGKKKKKGRTSHNRRILPLFFVLN